MELSDVYNNVKDQALSSAQILASDWIRMQVARNTQAPAIAPAPMGTLPVDVVQAQSSQSNLVFYVSIGVALFAAAFLLFNKKGKK